MVVKPKSSDRKSGQEKPGNYIDVFVKRMFGQIMIFSDFLLHYADKKFIADVDVTKIQPAPSHYFGKDGDERIVDSPNRCKNCPGRVSPANLTVRTEFVGYPGHKVNC